MLLKSLTTDYVSVLERSCYTGSVFYQFYDHAPPLYQEFQKPLERDNCNDRNDQKTSDKTTEILKKPVKQPE